jgi:arylsulfatase
MSKEKNIVIIAAYPAIEPATKNFDQLVQLVKDRKIKSDGMILVQKDNESNLTVSETGDHLGRRGGGWGGGVGLLVGLFAPPLLASVAVGAAAGAVVGKFAKHKITSEIESGLGEKLKPNTAAILAIVRETSAGV